jgi:hypothetical protein
MPSGHRTTVPLHHLWTWLQTRLHPRGAAIGCRLGGTLLARRCEAAGETSLPNLQGSIQSVKKVYLA